ncbi:MAG: hypothetical protein QM401_09910 [Bacillota bacterium]|nr:hypothetical protein [Bacillota bacterium]HHU61465.1 hypothetical protein [Natronincola sp.]
MGFLARLFSRGKGQTRAKQGYTSIERPHGVWVYFKCHNCGEKIPLRLRTTSEIQKREGPDAELGPGTLFVTKTIVGNECYQRIEATIDFDSRYNVVSSDVKNGELITKAEFERKDEHE